MSLRETSDPHPGRLNVKASCSMFSQILKLIPRVDFERLVKQTGAEETKKRSKASAM